jgi:predicted dehydrogenase
MASQGRIRVGVVGLGLIAQAVHLPNLLTLQDRFEVVAVCDVSGSVAATIADQLPGSPSIHVDWVALVRDPDVEAVLVLTPGSHGHIVEDAVRAGKHVLVEKPLGYSIAELERCRRASDESGAVLQVAYMKAYDPILPAARDALSRIGTPRVVRVTVMHPTDECQYEHLHVHRGADADPDRLRESQAYSDARLDEALGATAPGLRRLYEDVLLGSVIHEMALLRALGVGLPESFDFVSVDPSPALDKAPEPPRILAVGALPGGAQLQLSWNWLPDYPEYTEEVVVLGSAGRLTLGMPAPFLAAHRAHLTVQSAHGALRSVTSQFEGHETGFLRELRAFADSIQGGDPVLSDVDGAIDDIRALQALLGSAASREGLAIAGEPTTHGHGAR